MNEVFSRPSLLPDLHQDFCFAAWKTFVERVPERVVTGVPTLLRAHLWNLPLVRSARRDVGGVGGGQQRWFQCAAYGQATTLAVDPRSYHDDRRNHRSAENDTDGSVPSSDVSKIFSRMFLHTHWRFHGLFKFQGFQGFQVTIFVFISVFFMLPEQRSKFTPPTCTTKYKTIS